MCLALHPLLKECYQVKFQFKHRLAVLCLMALSSTVTIIVYNQSIHAIHTMQNRVQMHMSFTVEVTDVICKWYDCHPITIQNVAVAMSDARQDASFLINNLKVPNFKSILIVYSN